MSVTSSTFYLSIKSKKNNPEHSLLKCICIIRDTEPRQWKITDLYMNELLEDVPYN